MYKFERNISMGDSMKINKNNVVLVFDKDYDERLKSHIDPSKTAVLENPERSIFMNPHLYVASDFSKNEKLRTNPIVQSARELFDEQVQSVAQGLNLIKESYNRRDENGWGISNRSKEMTTCKTEKKDIPQLFMKTQAGELQPTNYFWQLLDRINECSIIEKQTARELGHSEGYSAAADIVSRANKGLCDMAAESEKLLKERNYPDLSYEFDYAMNVSASEQTSAYFQDIWELQQKHNLDTTDKMYYE